jgi:hypothetical protein
LPKKNPEPETSEKKRLKPPKQFFVLPESAYQPRFVVILAGPPQWRSRRVRSCATARCEDLPDSGWRKPLEIWRLNTNRNSIPCQNMYYY